VKVNQSFVAGIVDDRDDRAIVQAVIGLGRGLNLSVTAEGVETAEQVAILKDWKCDEAQGFYFGRPVPADELVDLLRTRCSAAG
jgi:EAL domain-containing protein (putative c-di-GMP-specific phosphodiesterase class I)